MKLKTMLSRLFYHVEDGSRQEYRVVRASVILSVIVFFLDVISKVLVVHFLRYPGTRVPVIPGLFDISYVTNRGAAWGLFAGKGAFLLTISVVVFILIICFLRRICEGWTERYYALLLVMSGILGNSCDRIFRGAVVDFLRFHWQNRIEWPSFNIADSAICTGVFLFVCSMLFRPDKKCKNDVSHVPANKAD